MFTKLLIANRGEIAVRIIRACKEMGIRTVAVYSKADAESIHVALADEAICIGEAAAKDSYLNQERIISAAIASKAQAIHPGYGFLAENASFAKLCKKYGIAFVGPSGELIDRMGDKDAARRLMKASGVPIIPGSGILENVDEAKKAAKEIGYPVMLKASAGGGGKGMRVSLSEDDFCEQFSIAQRESVGAFGDNTMYLERCVLNPRHVEVQVLADDFGNNIALCERDCSVQRRHQKLIEEAPSPALTEDLRRAMGVAAIKAVRATNYKNAGTIEFLLDERGSFYFMEMNTRVQVEHPVTEQITGTDIIKEQLRIASGEPMSCADRAPFSPAGHAMEFRINAEDPQHGFRPCPGTITKFEAPAGPGVRIDTGVEQGDTISPKFDSMMGKVIVTAQNRLDAVARVRRVLDELVIEGVPTPIPLFKEIFRNDDFTAEHGHPFAVSTKWLERTYLNRTPASAASGQPASLAAAPGAAAPAAPDKSKSETFVIEMNNRRVKLTVPLDIVENITGSARARGAKRPTQPLRGAGLHNVASSAAAANDGAKSGVIASPMQAVVTRINVSEGQQVAKGDLLVVLESMKMENYVYAPAAGEVKKIFVGPADGVEAGDTLVTLDVNAGKAKAAAAAPGSLPQAAASTAPSSEGADKATDAKKEGGND